MISGTYINNSTEQANASAFGVNPPVLDASGLVTRKLPNRLLVFSYNGSLAQSFFTTVQYSQKKQRPAENNGGTSTVLANSPFRTLGATVPGGLYYHAP